MPEEIRKIIYLSAPSTVSMADRWFEIADLDHFWVRRRFEAFQKLTANLAAEAHDIAEIGCGHGLFQRQIEEAYGERVAGFDLNEYALRRNLSILSPIYCYDIYEMLPEFSERFDLILLCDVLEHIADEGRFLEALIFHLAPGGHLLINVPAGQWAYSAYDRAAGHVRRYSIRTLRKAIAGHNLKITKWTYWGLPLVPTLLLRSIWLWGKQDKDEIISSGFDSRNGVVNRVLRWISSLEPTPQKLFGTSLMAVLRVSRQT
jgi:SAM-dependent methyltransferase